MDFSLVQRRIYIDTFGGGDYNIDMEENLGLRVPFAQSELIAEQPAESLYKTEQQKKLYRDFQEKRREAHS